MTISLLFVGGVAFLVYHARGGWTPERLEESIRTDLPVGSGEGAIESWAAAHGFLYAEDSYVAGYITATGTAEERLAELKQQGLRIITVDVDQARGVNVPGGGTMGVLRGPGRSRSSFTLKPAGSNRTS
jgi:hypothetical protein